MMLCCRGLVNAQFRTSVDCLRVTCGARTPNLRAASVVANCRTPHWVIPLPFF